MTKAEVDAACAKRTTAFPASTTGPAAGMGGNLGPNTDLSGWQDVHAALR